MNMYYIIITFAGPMRELYGWTDSEYIIKEFMRNTNDHHGEFIMVEFEGTMIDFIEYMNKEFSVGEMFSHFKLRLLTTRTGRTLIMTDDLFETIMGDTSIMYHMMTDILTSLKNLSLISKYVLDDSVKAILQYMMIKLMPKIVQAYDTGDIHNGEVDWIYLLLLEGYAVEVK